MKYPLNTYTEEQRKEILELVNKEKERISNLIVAQIGKARDAENRELKSVLMGIYNKINK